MHPVRRFLVPLAMAATALTLTSAGASSAQTSFADIVGNTHAANIDAIAAAGVTQGCDSTGTLYCPSHLVTRAQMATFLARALGFDEPGAVADHSTRFGDVTGIHARNIDAVADRGITLGCDASGALFCPDGPVTRAQMASFIARAFGLTSEGAGPFTDVSGVHADNISAIADADITLGCNGTGTLYCPLAFVPRDQMASFLARALGIAGEPPPADVIAAASCEQVDVQSAVALASAGDIVAVPAGACTWSGFALGKPVHLRGAGSSVLTITMNGELGVEKDPTYSVEVSGFTFERTGGGNSSKIMTVDGAWSDAPPLIHHNVFNVADSGTILYRTNGGLIHHNTFNGQWDESGFQNALTNDTESWSTADSMGMNDTTGAMNTYLEDNTFNGMTNQGTDFDGAARVVFRHNTMVNSSVNSHGLATSPNGVRHYEIYGNTFTYSADVSQNWMIWLRGGTGVIYDNHFDDIAGQMWGEKSELGLSVRAVNDGGILGCPTGYPFEHQIGQNHDGVSSFTDPLRMWDNAGTLVWEIREWTSTCGLDINDYLIEGRDFVFATSPKPGYVAYPYPHPLND